MEWIGPLIIGILLLSLVFQIIWCVSLSVIASKNGESDLIQVLAWIPLLQMVPMIRAGGSSVGRFILGSIAVFVGVIVLGMAAAVMGEGLGGWLMGLGGVSLLLLCLGYFALLFWNTATERDLPGWVGLLLFVPIINLFAYPYIAFHDGWEMPQKVGLVLGLLLTVGTFAPSFQAMQAMQENGGFPTDEEGWAALAQDPQFAALAAQMAGQEGQEGSPGLSLPSAAAFIPQPTDEENGEGGTPAQGAEDPGAVAALFTLQERFQALEYATSGAKLQDPSQRQAASAILQTTYAELDASRAALGEETYQELSSHLIEIESMLGGEGNRSSFSAARRERKTSFSAEDLPGPAAIANSRSIAPTKPLPVQIGGECEAGTELQSQNRDGQDEEWCEQSADRGGLRHGWYAKYSESGQPISVGEYRDGLRVGVWTRFYPEGSVRMQAEFSKGLQHGWLLSFDESGNRVKAVRFADGTAIR